jgi:hypothetical protein
MVLGVGDIENVKTYGSNDTKGVAVDPKDIQVQNINGEYIA